ncbi:MAG: hypothetical protein Q8T11_16765 [Elusimicrobiota bacterium]|nr:hypothetical protein [Elusimicrobiota bacterium]
MNEDDDARLAKAAMKSLHVPAPESLVADLKRLARKPAPSLWERLRVYAEGDSAWAYGAGAAFAAAGVGVILLRAAPERPAAPGVAERPALRIEAAPPQALADLWSDDDGGDNDEI